MTDYKSILTDLGYNLLDRGSYWQCAAVFRNGDNQTALKIYKDTGVWQDFVEGTKPTPFSALVEKSVGKEKAQNLLKNFSQATIIHHKPSLLKEEKTFPISSLKKLLPDRSYFEGRGISAVTQKAYQCGLATGGKLYQRIVFPIFREDGKIHGFSGRKVLQNNDRPKWLHYGKSADWFYPYYSVEGVQEEIEKEGSAFLIESIGDSMKLFQNKTKNNLTTFSNNIPPRMMARLSNLGVKIILSFNNDSGQNRGFDGALSSFLKLMDVVDFEDIYFYPPSGSDFGEMSDEETKEWRKGVDLTREGHKNCIERLLNYAPKAKLAKGLRSKVSKMKKEWEFRYL